MSAKPKKKDRNNKKALESKKEPHDEMNFLEYDAPYRDDPFKEHEVIIS